MSEKKLEVPGTEPNVPWTEGEEFFQLVKDGRGVDKVVQSTK